MIISNQPVFQWLFGPPLKRRILKYLYTSQGLVSERELARLLNVSHTAVNKVMKQLLDMNAVECISVGKALAWSLNKKSFTYPIIESVMPLLDTTPLTFVIKKLSLAITNKLASLNEAHKQLGSHLSVGLAAPYAPPVRSVHIFGSVADGTARPGSDIDVLILLEENYSAEHLKEQLQAGLGAKILEETGNPVSFHIYPWSAHVRNNPKWLKDAMDKGIKVY
jgi:predicted nucleotidyltransferase